MRAGLNLVAPGVGYFVVLLPAVVLAGAFFGTSPAAVAACVGSVMFAWLFQGRALLAWPPFNTQQLDTVLLLPACASVLWATHAMRRSAWAARDAEARLAEVFRQVPGAAAIIAAPDGALLLRSNRSDQILGHSERPMRAVTDLTSYQGLHPDGRPYRPEEYPIARALSLGEVVEAEKLSYRHPNGRIAELEVHAGPVRDVHGRIVAAVGMAFDVTARLETERALRDSEARHRALSERLRTAVEAGELGTWELELDTGIVHWDAATAAMFGLPRAPVDLDRAAAGQYLDQSDLGRLREDFARAMGESGYFAAEIRGRTAQGEDRWFAVRASAVPDTRRAVGVIRDITARRAREDLLREAVSARELLLREADHRIKNSLQIVVSLLNLQRSRLSDPDADAAITGAIARVNAVADAHLALQQSPDLRSVAVDAMARDLCERLATLNPDVTLRCEAPEIVTLDAEKAIPLGLVLSEIITNALRHAFAPGTAGTITVGVQARACGLLVAVADDGTGLPATPGRRGLGSTIIQSLSTQIGGTVATASAPGRGTTVTVRVPLAEAGAAAAVKMEA